MLAIGSEVALVLGGTPPIVLVERLTLGEVLGGGADGVALPHRRGGRVLSGPHLTRGAILVVVGDSLGALPEGGEVGGAAGEPVALHLPLLPPVLVLVAEAVGGLPRGTLVAVGLEVLNVLLSLPEVLLEPLLAAGELGGVGGVLIAGGVEGCLAPRGGPLLTRLTVLLPVTEDSGVLPPLALVSALEPVLAHLAVRHGARGDLSAGVLLEGGEVGLASGNPLGALLAVGDIVLKQRVGLPPIVLEPLLTAGELRLGGQEVLAALYGGALVGEAPLLAIADKVAAVLLLLPPLAVLSSGAGAADSLAGGDILEGLADEAVGLPPVAILIVVIALALLLEGAAVLLPLGEGAPHLDNTLRAIVLVPRGTALELGGGGGAAVALLVEASRLVRGEPHAALVALVLPLTDVRLLLPPLGVAGGEPVAAELVGLPPAVRLVPLLAGRDLRVGDLLRAALDDAGPRLTLALVLLVVAAVLVLLPPFIILGGVGVVEGTILVNEAVEGAGDIGGVLLVEAIDGIGGVAIFSRALSVLPSLTLELLAAALALGHTGEALALTVLVGLAEALEHSLVALLELLVEGDGVLRGLLLDLGVGLVAAGLALGLLAEPAEDLVGVLLRVEHVEHLREEADGHLREEGELLVGDGHGDGLEELLDGLSEILIEDVTLKVAAAFSLLPTSSGVIHGCFLNLGGIKKRKFDWGGEKRFVKKKRFVLRFVVA